MSDSEIIDQLKRLAEACPEDRCDVWVSLMPDRSLNFTAYVANRDKLPSKVGRGKTAKLAVDDVLPEVVGKRGVVQNIVLKKAEIAKLKAEAAKLESEIDPLLGAMVQAKEVQP